MKAEVPTATGVLSLGIGKSQGPSEYPAVRGDNFRAVGQATLQHLHANPGIYDEIDRLTSRLTRAFNAYCEKNEFSARIMSCGSLWQIFFNDEALIDFDDYGGKQAEGAFYLHCLNQGVFIHATHRCFMSAAHTDEDVDRLLSIFERALQLVRFDGIG
jgi:glutamate-1-semialdehyde 2,1-aminomutase